MPTAHDAVGVPFLAGALPALLDALEQAVANALLPALELGLYARVLVAERVVDDVERAAFLDMQLAEQRRALERERVQTQVVRVVRVRATRERHRGRVQDLDRLTVDPGRREALSAACVREGCVQALCLVHTRFVARTSPGRAYPPGPSASCPYATHLRTVTR
jgi:hypothetical protein